MENIKKALLIIAIAIVFFAFILYAKETIYSSPRYDDFCEFNRIPAQINYSDKDECEAAGGRFEEHGRISEGWCNLDYYCSQEYNKARETDQKYSFFIFLSIAIITIVVSLIYIKTGTIAVGFLSGGLLLLLYSIMSYWQNFPDIIRTVLLGIALVILVYVAYKKFNK